MRKIKLNSIVFNIDSFKDISDEDGVKYQFSIISTGERDFQLTKAILGKKNLTYQMEDENELNVKVSSYSYTDNGDIDDFTESRFDITIKEYNEDEEHSPTAALAMEIFDLNNKFDTLVSLLESKELIKTSEFEELNSERFKNMKKNDLSDFVKRVFGVEVNGNDK